MGRKAENPVLVEKKRACIYIRVSTEAQESDGYSLEEQERLCKASIESKEWSYTETYCDGGYSGKSMERPALQRMMSDVREGKVDAVFIYKLDRLSRSQKDTLTIIEDVLLPNKVDIVSLKETLDTSTPWGRAMIGILASFNQLDRETIVMRTTMGRRAKAKSGGWTGGTTPYGYRTDGKELVVDEVEAEMVREVFRMRGEGLSYRKIADALEASGYIGREGVPIKYTTVGSILNNEDLYRGIKTYAGVQARGNYEAILAEESDGDVRE